ncbi:hypothetical protein [Lactococcus petauri]|uniref:hypothetical protein n=1 Tax=Lactococcus petauri TaxID=1940789 RepID=UPI00254BDE0F|nr:hypothetical protein [Lactococcus petauri]
MSKLKDTRLFVAQSFRINAKEVPDLTSKKILELSKARMKDGDENTTSSKIEVIHHSIQRKPGKYKAVLGVMNEEGEKDELEIDVTVWDSKKPLMLFLSALAIFSLLAGWWWYSHQPATVASGLPVATTEKMSPVALKKYAQQEVDKSNVTVQVYPHVYIKSDGETGKMYVQNVPVNKTGQVATLKDKVSGETLYTSELLKPGYQVSKVHLMKRLSKGEHPGLVTLTFYDLKEKKQVGRANVAVTIHVAE